MTPSVHVLGQGQAGAGLFGDLPAGLDQTLLRPQRLGRAQAHIHAQLAACHHQRVAHVVAGIAQIAVGDLVEMLVAVLHHGQDVADHLGGMELVGQAVPDRHTRKFAQNFHQLLAKAAVLDAVVHAPQHTGGILHGFLVRRSASLMVPGR